MGGSLAVLAVAVLGAGSPVTDADPVAMKSMAPLVLAENIIEREPGLLILDLRSDVESAKGIPGAVAGRDPTVASTMLAGTPEGTVVVVYDETGSLKEPPAEWSTTLQYRFPEGGFAGWVDKVLTPASIWGNSLAERDRVQRQNQVSAFFSGAAVQSSSVAAPPPLMPAGGSGKAPKAGGY
jgi:rhodanese-related sulfurtransferase